MTTDRPTRRALPVLLLPSPLLPDSVHVDLRAALVSHGFAAIVAPAGLDRGQNAHVIVERWARLVDPDTVLVAHSNAGYLAPLVRATGAPGCPIVFVDAALPPAEGDHALAPATFRDWLGELAGPDGRLPPWTRWWPRADLDEVIPADRFDAIDEACPRLPLDYFDTRLTAPSGWTQERNAYLAFGDTYADEVAFAAQHGWPCVDLDGSHLALLTEPDAVADAIAALVGELTG